MTNKKRILGNSTLATALIFCLWQPDALAVPLLTNANRSESLLAQIEADTEVFEDTPVTLVQTKTLNLTDQTLGQAATKNDPFQMSPDEIKELMSNDVHTPTAKDDDINVGVGAAFYNPSQMQYDYTTPGYNDSGCDCCCGGCGVSAYDQYYNQMGALECPNLCNVKILPPKASQRNGDGLITKEETIKVSSTATGLEGDAEVVKNVVAAKNECGCSVGCSKSCGSGFSTKSFKIHGCITVDEETQRCNKDGEKACTDSRHYSTHEQANTFDELGPEGYDSSNYSAGNASPTTTTATDSIKATSASQTPAPAPVTPQVTAVTAPPVTTTAPSVTPIVFSPAPTSTPFPATQAAFVPIAPVTFPSTPVGAPVSPSSAVVPPTPVAPLAPVTTPTTIPPAPAVKPTAPAPLPTPAPILAPTPAPITVPIPVTTSTTPASVPPPPGPIPAPGLLKKT